MNRKDAEKYFEAFATTTVLRVFNFIRTSQFRLEQLFWIVVLIGFTAATVSSVTETFTKFYSEPTASQVSIAKNISGDGLVFPHAVVCLQFSGASLFELYKRKINESIAIVLSTPDLLQRIKRRIDQYHEREVQMAADLHASLENVTTKDHMHPLMAIYHQPRADFFSGDEIALLGLTMLMYWRLMYAEMGKTGQLAWKAETLLPLYQAYREREIDFSELFALTREASCVLLQISIIRSHLNLENSVTTKLTYNACKQWKMIFFGIYFGGQEMICFKVANESPFVFNTSFDHVTLTMRADWLANSFAPDLTQIGIDPTGAFTVLQQELLLASFSARQSITFAIESVNTLLDLRRRPCAAQTTRKGSNTECKWWCAVESVIANCACMPLWRQLIPQFADLPTNLSSCALKFRETFLGAMSKCAAGPGGFQCSQRCLENCETYVLNNVAYVGDPVLNYINATPAIRLMATKFVYDKVDEYITMDSKALVAALGGNLSLFLGASFLALIHIVVFVVRIPFTHLLQTSTAGPVTTSKTYSDAMV